MLQSSRVLAICLLLLLAAESEQAFKEVTLYRSFVILVSIAIATICMAPTVVARPIQQSPDSDAVLAGAQIKDDLPALPISSLQALVPLLPALPHQAPAATNSFEQAPLRPACDCQKISQGETQVRHRQQIQASLLKLQTGKKHSVHVYLANQTQKQGRILSIGEDSFVLKVAKDKPELTILYKDISWVTKEPTGGEKFGRGLGLTVGLLLLAPFWVPIALIWWASGGD